MISAKRDPQPHRARTSMALLIAGVAAALLLGCPGTLDDKGKFEKADAGSSSSSGTGGGGGNASSSSSSSSSAGTGGAGTGGAAAGGAGGA